MAPRLSDTELANYENIIAVSLRITQSIKRAVYFTNDPDVLAELVRITEDAARIRRLTMGEMARRRLERKRPSAGQEGQETDGVSEELDLDK